MITPNSGAARQFGAAAQTLRSIAQEWTGGAGAGINKQYDVAAKQLAFGLDNAPTLPRKLGSDLSAARTQADSWAKTDFTAAFVDVPTMASQARGWADDADLAVKFLNSGKAVGPDDRMIAARTLRTA